MTETELRARVVARARDWLGKNEADGSFRDIVRIYNAIEPLPVGYRLKDTDPWCAAFVSAVGVAARLGDVLLPECSCARMAEKYRAAGRWVEEGGYLPQPGDLIFYGWNDSGAGDYLGPPDHVGIVESCDGAELTALEGNLRAAVGRRRMAVDGRFIRGYALPDYDGAARRLTAEEPAFTDVPEDAWYAEALRWAAGAGVIRGFADGSFRPDRPLTRAEAVEMLFRALRRETMDN